MTSSFTTHSIRYFCQGRSFVCVCVLKYIRWTVSAAQVWTRPVVLTTSIWSPSDLGNLYIFCSFSSHCPNHHKWWNHWMYVCLCSSSYFLTQPRGPMISEISEGLSECLCPEVISFHPCSSSSVRSYVLHTTQFCNV